MWQLISEGFNSTGLIPHGYCLQWNPALLWTLVTSDAVIAASYFSIPFAIWYFARKRPDISNRWLFGLFGLFIVACGTTHFFDVLTIWVPSYWPNAIAKATTAILSLGTAIVLWRFMPIALMSPSANQLEVKVREGRAHLDAALRSMTDAVCISDAAGRFIEFNDAFATFHKFSDKAACAKTFEEFPTFLDVYSPEGTLVPVDQWAVPRALRGETDTNVEFALHRRDSGEEWIGSYNFSPIRNARGEVVGSVVTARDITALKQKDEAFIKSETKFRTLFDSTTDAVMLMDDQGYFECNQATLDLFGCESKEVFYTKHPADLSPPQQPCGTNSCELAMQHIAIAKAQGNFHFEWLHKRLNSGKPFHADVLLTSLQLGERSVIQGVVRDITESKKVELALRNSELEFRQLAESMPQIVWITRADGWNIYFNHQWVEYTGLTLEESYGHGWNTPFHPDDQQRAWEAWQHAVNHTAPYSLECQLRRSDGTYRWWLVRGVPIRGVDGEILKWFGTCTDIHDLKRNEDSLQLAAMVYRTSAEGIIVTDAEGIIVAVNPAFSALTGYAPDEVIGNNPSILSSGRHDRAFYQSMWETLDATGKWQGEVFNRRKNGEVFAEWLSINNINKDDGSVYRRVGMFSDISERKKSEEVIWQQANFDGLTGLPNRRMVFERLELELKKSHRDGKPVALLFIDLDRFKEVNDSFGHAVGDDLLKEAAVRMSSCVRDSDIVGRTGGDEFTVVIGDLDDILSVERVAQAILAKLSDPFELGDKVAYVSASIGITLYPNDAKDVATLFKYADQAMYAAKSQGRDQFSYYTSVMQDAANLRMRLVNDLHKALDKEQFRVYYQPIVDLRTDEIYKAEALVRWEHPKYGLIGPVSFIPIAEETGLIHDIGNWVFHQAARQVGILRATYNPEFQISVNKSPIQFRREASQHTSWVIGHLKMLGLSGDSIVVEITESMLMENIEEISSQLISFRDNGIQVAMDDFGTGYSSLSYLKKFHIDYIKIDQSFVRNLTPDSSDLALCEAMVVMAHKLGIKVIAEGVETQLQRELLTNISCDYGQGYLWSKPVPIDAFEQLLIATKDAS